MLSPSKGKSIAPLIDYIPPDKMNIGGLQRICFWIWGKLWSSSLSEMGLVLRLAFTCEVSKKSFLAGIGLRQASFLYFVTSSLKTEFGKRETFSKKNHLMLMNFHSITRFNWNLLVQYVHRGPWVHRYNVADKTFA